MNMFARFDENPATTLQDIKKQNVTDGHTHARTDGQRENSIPTTNKVGGGYNNCENSIPTTNKVWGGGIIILSFS